MSKKEKQKQFINSNSELIKKAAQKREVKFEALLPSLFFYRLSLEKKSYLFCEGMCDLVSAPAYIAANRKNLSCQFLKKWNIPIPESLEVKNFNECLDFLKEYKKVAIKPFDLSWGRGVTAGVTDEKILKEAIDYVHDYVQDGEDFLIQEFLEGDDHRIFVIGYKKIFCLQRIPAFLTGDGKSRIKDLIKKRKITVGLMKHFLKVPQSKIDIALQSQGLDMNSIPSKNRKVKLSTTANLHSGGFTIDKTDVVCKEAIDISKGIAKKFAIPALGVDFISKDISKGPGKVVELNPIPDLAWHTNPNFGKGHNPAEALIDFLFFSGKEKDLKRKTDLS